MRESLTHSMHLKRELELLQGFDSQHSHLPRMPSFFFTILEILWARKGVRTRNNKVVKYWSKEHRGFAKQQEENAYS